MAHLLAFFAGITLLNASPLATTHTNGTCNPQAPANPGPGVEHHQVTNGGTYLWSYQVFKSSPFNPPVWEINVTEGASLAPGLIFVTTGDTTELPTTKMPAPQIFTDNGQLVWSGPEINSTNLKWQMYDGEPTLTYWSGLSTAGANIGHGYGNITFLDTTYKTKTVLCPNFSNYNTAGDGTFECEADIHESYLTEHNTMLNSAYNATRADLTSVGGPADGWIWDSQFYEIDPKTGQELFRWSPFEHVPVNKTFIPLDGDGNSTSPFDYFHLNSVVNIGEDYYLANSRHTWTIYLLNKTGDIVWEFNGNDGGDFGPLPEDVHFSWEHYVRPHNITNDTIEISMFNNNNYRPGLPHTNATDLLVYTLPLDASSPAVLKSRITYDTPLLYAESQGSYFPHLPNGNQLANYGQLPLIKEFDHAGQELWSGRIAPNNLAQVYRGYKLEWHATPYTCPDLVVEDGMGYVSWNGATEVEGWNVYVGTEKDGMKMVGKTGFRGFETMFHVPCWAKYVQVGAVEKNGTEVRRSEVVEVM